ncbi:hypothetical protein OFD71_29020, partial [Escherichia coli]|nr:hypothetical protein [Escherichia coli]
LAPLIARNSARSIIYSKKVSVLRSKSNSYAKIKIDLFIKNLNEIKGNQEGYSMKVNCKGRQDLDPCSGNSGKPEIKACLA